MDLCISEPILFHKTFLDALYIYTQTHTDAELIKVSPVITVEIFTCSGITDILLLFADFITIWPGVASAGGGD